MFDFCATQPPAPHPAPPQQTSFVNLNKLKR